MGAYIRFTVTTFECLMLFALFWSSALTANDETKIAHRSAMTSKDAQPSHETLKDLGGSAAGMFARRYGLSRRTQLRYQNASHLHTNSHTHVKSY